MRDWLGTAPGLQASLPATVVYLDGQPSTSWTVGRVPSELAAVGSNQRRFTSFDLYRRQYRTGSPSPPSIRLSLPSVAIPTLYSPPRFEVHRECHGGASPQHLDTTAIS